MKEIPFEELAQRLTPDALELLQEMASAHLESTGDRMFIRADSSAGTHMIFTGDGSRRQFNNFDGGAIQDLLAWNLLHLDHSESGTPNYRVAGEALRFHRSLMQLRGSAVDQVDQQVHQTIDGAGFAAAHPGGAHHLREAFDLLWGGRTEEQIVSEIGDHLRKAMMDVTTDVVGSVPGDQERPIERLKARVRELRVPDREAETVVQLVQFARVVLRLDHRLNHVRDEVDLGEPSPSWEETRRAAFMTAFVCSELDRLHVRQG